MIFATKINEIPCYCRVDHYSPGAPARLSGPMEDAEEALDEEFEFSILDHRYILAPWLVRQLTDDDCNRLLEEFHTTVLEEKHLYGADDHNR